MAWYPFGRAMPGSARRTKLLEYVQSRQWSAVGEADWALIRSEFPELSESCIRNWLREAGIPVAQPYAGVQTRSLEELEVSLLALAGVYIRSPGAARLCRAEVIAAKDRARFASRNSRASSEKRALKAEMVEWMLVWLGDPAMFATWAAMRKRIQTANPLT